MRNTTIALFIATGLVAGFVLGAVTHKCPDHDAVLHELDSLRRVADDYTRRQKEKVAEADTLRDHTDSVVASQPVSVIVREQVEVFKYAPVDSIRAALMTVPQ